MAGGAGDRNLIVDCGPAGDSSAGGLPDDVRRRDARDRLRGRVPEPHEPEAVHQEHALPDVVEDKRRLRPLLRLRMQLGVLDRRRRPPRELLCKREVPGPEPAVGRRDEGDRAEDAASREERHRHERSDAQLLDQPAVLFVPRDLADDLVRHLRHELRLAGADDGAGSIGRLLVLRVPLVERPDQRQHVGVGVSGCEASQAPLLRDHVDQHLVGKRRNSQLGEPLQRRLVLERRAEELTRPGEKRHLRVGGLGVPRAPHAPPRRGVTA